MSNDNNNQPVRETVVVDGSDPTDQEKALMEQGLDLSEEEGGEAKPAAATPKAEGEGGEAAGADDGAATAAAADDGKAGDGGAAAGVDPDKEAERLAAEQAEQERQAQIERENAEAKANAEAIAKAAPTEEPAPPVDFDAAYAELEQQREDGDLEHEEYARKLRDLTKQETAHTLAVHEWKAEQRRLVENAEQARNRAENAWNAAALQWEADNQDFMSDRVNQTFMQEAINAIIAANQRDGIVASPTAVLTEAAASAFRRANWSPATPPPKSDGKSEIKNAIGERKQPNPPTTLGDVPNAGNEPIRGNEAYAALDRAGIEDVEEAASRMSPAEQERWLRDAPGANANGRGADE